MEGRKEGKKESENICVCEIQFEKVERDHYKICREQISRAQKVTVLYLQSITA